MLNQIILFILFILSLLVIILILINLKTQNKNNETFLIRDYQNFVDGQMNFEFLTDPNYKNNILNRYYINDDTKINGNRVIIHPNQSKHYNYYNGYYGNTPNLSYSDYIYNTFGVRL